MPPGPGFDASSFSQSRVMIDASEPNIKHTPPLRFWTRRQPPTLFYERHFLQRRALWVHRPPGFAEVFQDGAWVEVTHCSYGINKTAEPFFFAASGSGVWINVGRSLRLDFRDERGPLIHRAIADGEFGEAVRLLDGVDLSTYDSIQFSQMHGGTWPADVLTEFVVLKLRSESDTLAKFLPSLQCGPSHRRRPCRADDAAVVQQTDCRLPHLNIHAGVDARPLDAVASPGVHAVLERSGCDVANCSMDAARATAWSTTAPANHHLCGRAHHRRHHRKTKLIH